MFHQMPNSKKVSLLFSEKPLGMKRQRITDRLPCESEEGRLPDGDRLAGNAGRDVLLRVLRDDGVRPRTASGVLRCVLIGFHLCGAYQRNRARRYGLLDEQEKPDEENVALMKAANEQIARWMDEQF